MIYIIKVKKNQINSNNSLIISFGFEFISISKGRYAAAYIFKNLFFLDFFFTSYPIKIKCTKLPLLKFKFKLI